MVTTVDAAMDTARAAAPEPMDKLLDRLGERLGSQATVRAVFGEPVVRGEVTVMPVARVRWGYGGGAGSGPMVDAATNGHEPASGSGGGGGVMADPMGYLEVRSTGATYVPLAPPYLNPWLVLAIGVSVGVVVRALARLIRG